MKFTLKPYQDEAVDNVLNALEHAREIYAKDATPSSLSLSATTGAGKTVMAAAVIEALFWGNQVRDVQPDDGAVVIWFSDDPNLNEQTKDRLRQASEKFTHDQLVTVKPPFAQPRLEPHKVYFLNTQRLSSSSLLTRGHYPDDATPQFETMTAHVSPDLQGWTIWETIANTIDADDLTVYLILDEAHRGFNTRKSGDRQTIVRRLVDGHAGYPPIPIVWGISATIERFKEAMKDADKDRRVLPPIDIEPSRVQESGLVKDTIVIEIPDEAGNFDTVLVRRTAKKLRESSERWKRYAVEQGSLDVVQPLLVLQTPNKPDHDQIALALDEILKVFPEFTGDSVRHVFGEHKVQKFGTWEVDWIEPQRVEESTNVRVLVAKDAISTGWDCPRAEVLVSFRPAKDQTHITQLLGRMVRNPLARRVPGDDVLNAVDCILPFFDRPTASTVAKFLSGKIDDLPGGGKRVLLDGRELTPNEAIPTAVWEAWGALPTMTLPRRGARPVKRLVALSQALSASGVRQGALRNAESIMHKVLDSLAVRHEDELETAVEEVWAVRGVTIAGAIGSDNLTYTEFVERADDRSIRASLNDAKKVFGADVAVSYVNHLAGDDDEDDDGLREAYVKAAGLALVPEVVEKVDEEANELADEWLAEHRVAIKELPDGDRQTIEELRAATTDPQRGTLGRPRTRLEDYAVEDADGKTVAAPTVDRHLMADESGEFPLSSLNDWEEEVVRAELARKSCVAWYRNPPRVSTDSLGIAYQDDKGDWRSMHPDFIFFNDVGDEVRASIVDPHGTHLGDSLLKLRALADFAEGFGSEFHRIEALAKVGTQMRVLDMQDAAVRSAIRDSDATPDALYADYAVDYDVRSNS